MEAYNMRVRACFILGTLQYTNFLQTPSVPEHD